MDEVLLQGYKQLVLFASKEAKKGSCLLPEPGHLLWLLLGLMAGHPCLALDLTLHVTENQQRWREVEVPAQHRSA